MIADMANLFLKVELDERPLAFAATREKLANLDPVSLVVWLCIIGAVIAGWAAIVWLVVRALF